MRLRWEREGVVRMTARLEELAHLVAGARIALRVLEQGEMERAEELGRVLGRFDRAARALQQEPIPAGDPAPEPSEPSGAPPSVHQPRAPSGPRRWKPEAGRD